MLLYYGAYQLYNRIITHDDFDGIVSSVICSYVFNIEDIQFAGPRTITESLLTITEDDIVCDLPYPLRCGLWFDHHQGNEEELKYRGIDNNQLEGRFALEPSCSRVVYFFLMESHEITPQYIEKVKYFKAKIPQTNALVPEFTATEYFVPISLDQFFSNSFV